jgi:signal transduction histidine kinase
VRSGADSYNACVRGHTEESPWNAVSPIRVFLLVLAVVFAAEGAIMLLLPRLPNVWAEAAFDASVLTAITAPAIWLLSVRPLRRLFEARGSLLRRLFELQEDERARVARDLHDGVGQHLTALLVGLRTIEAAGDLETARARAGELRSFGARAHDEVRALTRGLRPIALEELGLVAALERLCEDVARTHGIETELECDRASIARLAPECETALYRIAQEALSNAARHADPRGVAVRLHQDAQGTLLAVTDDGRGFDPDARADRRGFGLQSIRERAEALGGEVSLRSDPGRGTRLEVRIPARPAR